VTAFWAARTTREKLMLIGVGAILVAYLAFAALWQPLVQQRAAMMADIARYARLQPALAIAAANAGGSGLPASAEMPIPTILTETAGSFGLTIRRLQPSGTTAEVTLDDAAFDTVLPWIDVLERDHALRIVAVSMARRPAPGLISTTLTVAR
jgi:general secretion pathway protein M